MKKLVSVIISIIMLVAVVGCMQVYAAGMSKPSVKATSTSATTIKLTWGKVSGATKYKVYRATSKSGSYKTLSTTSAFSYSNTGLTCGKTYYYKVKAYNSKTSATCSVISKKAVPATVTGVKATNYCTSNKISWSKSSGATGYQVVYATSSGGKYTTLATTTSLTTTQSKLSVGVTRYYKVRAYKTVKSTKIYGSYSAVVSKKSAHIATTWATTKAPTCSATGISSTKCKYCGKTYTKAIAINPAAHNYVESKDENTGKITYTCSYCGDTYHEDTVCYIDLTAQTVDISTAANFNYSSSKTEGAFDKLDITPNGCTVYEITGDATGLTIDVNADKDVEIKLNNATITNDGEDCIDVKNKSTDESIEPEVSISAKDGTTNTLTATTSGNAVDSSTKLVIKGHGVINMNTVSTTVNSSAKVEIKNATVNVTSQNRGIDTKTIKTSVVNDIQVIEELYYNVELGANAKITFNTVDDCIRCKNFETTALEEGDTNSVINLTSTTGDGIQIEGSKAELHSGILTINAKKYAFNCKESKVTVDDTATVNLTGGSGNYKS